MSLLDSSDDSCSHQVLDRVSGSVTDEELVLDVNEMLSLRD